LALEDFCAQATAIVPVVVATNTPTSRITSKPAVVEIVVNENPTVPTALLNNAELTLLATLTKAVETIPVPALNVPE
jgi:hypothetical protein